MKNFREIYCENRGITVEQYEHELVSRCLHPRARPFYWLLGWSHQYTSPDYEFVRNVGELRHRRGFRDEAAEYHYHPGNIGLLRRVLRIRVSSQRLQEIFEQMMPAALGS